MPTTNFRNFTDFSDQNFYIGIDVHKKSWTVTVRSLDVQVDYFTQPPIPEALVKHLKKKFLGGRFFSAYEAGFMGTTLHERLRKLGISNIIVNPGDIPSTDKQKKNKTDLHDSRAIAEYLEKGSLHSIHILPPDQQELRALFRQLMSKVRDLTRAYINLQPKVSTLIPGKQCLEKRSIIQSIHKLISINAS